MKEKARSHCPIAFALDLFGDTWSLLVLRDLIFKNKRHYQEFLNSGESISTNILADRLRRLEENGFIQKAPDPSNKKQIIYSPTNKGLDLIPVMLEMIRWSGKYDPKTAAPKEFLEQLKKDSKKLAAQMRSQHEK